MQDATFGHGVSIDVIPRIASSLELELLRVDNPTALYWTDRDRARAQLIAKSGTRMVAQQTAEIGAASSIPRMNLVPFGIDLSTSVRAIARDEDENVPRGGMFRSLTNERA
jgi:hypothetical protein